MPFLLGANIEDGLEIFDLSTDEHNRTMLARNLLLAVIALGGQNPQRCNDKRPNRAQAESDRKEEKSEHRNPRKRNAVIWLVAFQIRI